MCQASRAGVLVIVAGIVQEPFSKSNVCLGKRGKSVKCLVMRLPNEDFRPGAVNHSRTVQARRLPGIGPRSAERLALYIVQTDAGFVKQLAAALVAARERIQSCQNCGGLTEEQPGAICADPRRDASLVSIVERAASPARHQSQPHGPQAPRRQRLGMRRRPEHQPRPRRRTGDSVSRQTEMPHAKGVKDAKAAGILCVVSTIKPNLTRPNSFRLPAFSFASFAPFA